MVHEISLEELHWDALSWRNLYSCLLTTGHPWTPLLTEVWIKQLIHISWSNSLSNSFQTCAQLTESYDSLNSNNCNWRCLFSIAWLLELLWTSRTEESQRPQGMACHFPVMIIGTWLGCLLYWSYRSYHRLFVLICPTIGSSLEPKLQIVEAFS